MAFSKPVVFVCKTFKSSFVMIVLFLRFIYLLERNNYRMRGRHTQTQEKEAEFFYPLIQPYLAVKCMNWPDRNQESGATFRLPKWMTEAQALLLAGSWIGSGAT